MKTKFNPLTGELDLVESPNTPIILVSGNANVDCKLDTITHVEMNSPVSFTFENDPADGKYHDIGIILVTGEDTYSAEFPANVVWYRELLLEPNHRYYINIYRGDAIWISFPIGK